MAEQAEGTLGHGDGAETLREYECKRDWLLTGDGDPNVVVGVVKHVGQEGNEIGIHNAPTDHTGNAQCCGFAQGLRCDEAAAYHNSALMLFVDVLIGERAIGAAGYHMNGAQAFAPNSKDTLHERADTADHHAFLGEHTQDMPTYIGALFYRQRRGANADIAGCRGDKLYGAAERSVEPATEKPPKKPRRFGQKVSFLHSVALFYFEHLWQS